jgi:hypothetical protein
LNVVSNFRQVVAEAAIFRVIRQNHLEEDYKCRRCLKKYEKYLKILLLPQLLLPPPLLVLLRVQAQKQLEGD